MRQAQATGAVGAGGVLGVTEAEGDLGGAAIPGALGETVVLEAAAGRAAAVEVLLQGSAAAGVVLRLVRHFAFDADVLQRVDGGGGGGFGVAVWEERAAGRVAAVGTGGDFGGGAAARVEGIGCRVWCGGLSRI